MRHVVFAAAALFLLSGCGPSRDARETAASPPPAAATPAAAPVRTTDACGLVTKAEVEQILGTAVGEPQSLPGASSADVSFTQCTFASPEGDKTLGVALRVSKKGDGQPEAARQVMVSSGAKVEDVPGLADAAFWAGMQLQAFRGRHAQLVVTVLGFPNGKDAAVQVARKALARL
ncbi:MAG TPA: hypothetical protein VFO85_16645 [Vicinamibacteria bacterium]|nr:hypothetical protein [Vicinamibacteria bacterium]